MNPKKLEVGALSETGYVRTENQDHMSGSRVPLGYLYIVADGMGGHKGGAIASALTDEGLQRFMKEAKKDAEVEKVARDAFKAVNEEVFKKAHSGNLETEGMGSTAVMLLIQGDVANVAHVGDSRAYLYSKGTLRQLTSDHSFVQKMVDAGILKASEAAGHPNANILDRAIGIRSDVAVDVTQPLTLNDGDAVLLCTDGLTGYVSDKEIAEVLRGSSTVQEVPQRLVELALGQGGEDNITIQFVQFGARTEARTEQKKKTPSNKTSIILLFVAALLVTILGFQMIESSETRRQLAQTRNEAQNLRKLLDKVMAERGKAGDHLKELQNTLSKSRNNLMTLKSDLSRRKDLQIALNKKKKESARLSGQLAEKEDQLLQSRAVAEDYRQKLQAAESRGGKLLFLVLAFEAGSEAALPNEALAGFIRDVGAIEIRWIEKEAAADLLDLPEMQLSGQSMAFYSSGLGQENLSSLFRHMKSMNPSGYPQASQMLKDAVTKKIGHNREHVLLVLKRPKGTEKAENISASEK